MRYQYKREPLTQDEANRLANACQTHTEKLVVWTLLDTGLRVAELATLTKDNLDWQHHRLMIYGKGGPYGKLSNVGSEADAPAPVLRPSPATGHDAAILDVEDPDLGYDAETFPYMQPQRGNRPTFRAELFGLHPTLTPVANSSVQPA